jgi:hypothetical protein
MSSFDMVLDRLGKAYAELARLELDATASAPSVFGVTQIESVRRIVSQLEAEWEELARAQLFEVCRYRVVDNRSGYFSVSPLLQSVSKFQELFSQIFDAIQNGPRERARLTAGVEQESDLKLAYTFPGSFGFVLVASGEPGLFADKFDDTAEAVVSIMSSADEFDIRDLATTLGQAVVKRTYEWSKTNADAGYGLDFKWSGTHERDVRSFVEPSHFRKLVEIIESTIDRQESIIETKGVLLGMDTKTKRFRFHSQPFGEDYSGLTSDQFDLSKDWTLNHRYTARILAQSETRYSTLETKNQFTLLALTEL